jgi:hypothetical protein
VRGGGGAFAVANALPPPTAYKPSVALSAESSASGRSDSDGAVGL